MAVLRTGSGPARADAAIDDGEQLIGHLLDLDLATGPVPAVGGVAHADHRVHRDRRVDRPGIEPSADAARRRPRAASSCSPGQRLDAVARGLGQRHSSAPRTPRSPRRCEERLEVLLDQGDELGRAVVAGRGHRPGAADRRLRRSSCRSRRAVPPCSSRSSRSRPW